MSDLPVTPEGWRDTLDTALEHASHAWGALRKQGAKEKEPDMWPPKSLDEVGSAAYHVAALIDYVFEVYQGIAKVYPEQEGGPTLREPDTRHAPDGGQSSGNHGGL